MRFASSLLEETEERCGTVGLRWGSTTPRISYQRLRIAYSSGMHGYSSTVRLHGFCTGFALVALSYSRPLVWSYSPASALEFVHTNSCSDLRLVGMIVTLARMLASPHPPPCRPTRVAEKRASARGSFERGRGRRNFSTPSFRGPATQSICSPPGLVNSSLIFARFLCKAYNGPLGQLELHQQPVSSDVSARSILCCTSPSAVTVMMIWPLSSSQAPGVTI